MAYGCTMESWNNLPNFLRVSALTDTGAYAAAPTPPAPVVSAPSVAPQAQDNELHVASIALLGDSITEGASPQGSAYGDYLRIWRNVTITNLGVSGNTTAQMFARVNTAIAAGEAVFIMGGYNDCAQGVAVSTIKAQLRGIVTYVQDAGRTAVLLGTIPGSQPAVAACLRDLNVAVLDVAVERGSYYVPLWKVVADPANQDYQWSRANAGGTHLAPWGAFKVAQRIATELGWTRVGD